MRRATPVLMLSCALLIAAFSGFSPIAFAGVVVSAVVIMTGEWMERKVVGIAGFLILAISAAETADFPDLTVPINIALVGLLLVLPLSFTLWFSLTIGSYSDDRLKIRYAPYVWAALFVAIVLSSVPITGIVLHSTRFNADIGIESQVILIGFITAILAVALLGGEEKR